MTAAAVAPRQIYAHRCGAIAKFELWYLSLHRHELMTVNGVGTIAVVHDSSIAERSLLLPGSDAAGV